MKPTPEDIAFVRKLEGLVPDRGAMAHLRRGLGKPPGTAFEMDRYVLTALPEKAFRTQEEACYIVAALFAHWHQGKDNPVPWEDQVSWNRSLGRSLRILVEREPSKREDLEKREKSIERRLNALLNSHRDDLPDHLRRVVSLLKAKDVPVHWPQLLNDIQNWDTESRAVQHEWAKGFWATSQEQPLKD